MAERLLVGEVGGVATLLLGALAADMVFERGLPGREYPLAGLESLRLEVASGMAGVLWLALCIGVAGLVLGRTSPLSLPFAVFAGTG